MNPKTWSFGIVLPLAVASAVANISKAQAASLTGEGSISLTGSVRIFGQAGVDSLGATSFDFIPPEDGVPFGDFPAGVSSFAVVEGTATGGFSEFSPGENAVGTGEQQDITVQSLAVDNVFALAPPATPIDLPTNPIEDFVVLEGGDMADTTFTLESIEAAAFEEIDGDLVATVEVGGTFLSNGVEFSGSGTYTAEIEEVTETEFFAGIVSGAVFTESYSAEYVAEAEEPGVPGPTSIPEPTSLMGLTAALGLAASFLRRKH